MAQIPKYEQVMSIIERRVREGDYLLHNIPGERRIAEDTGVSYMTARRAISELLVRKVLTRKPNGSLDVHPRYVSKREHAKVVLLYPAYPSPYLAQLRLIVTSALEEHELSLRPVQYVHWDDPIVTEALRNRDGAIVIPSTDEIPAWIRATMQSNKAVILDGNLSNQGVPSIELFPDEHILEVFDYLARLGHRRIDCVNTQHRNPGVDRRIALWEQWLDENKLSGELFDDPAPSFVDPTPYALVLARQLIDKQRLTGTALVCTTFPAAMGAARALWEKGRTVGKDISVCSVNIEQPARFCCPSITGLDMPDLSDTLARCFDWFAKDRPWRGSALLTPERSAFFEGESCGRCGDEA